MLLSQINKRKNRGAVGIRTGPNKWEGVFVSDDSNPVAFTEQLWQMLQENWQSLGRWGEELLEYGYWDEYMNDGICPYCGKSDVGQPHKINGLIHKQYLSGKFIPDPQAISHTHLKSSKVLSKNAKVDGLWIEWVYIIDPKTYSLEVLRAVYTGEFFMAKRKSLADVEVSFRQPIYRYFPLKLFSLLGDEPDWQTVEQQGLSVSRYYHEKFQRYKKIAL